MRKIRNAVCTKGAFDRFVCSSQSPGNLNYYFRFYDQSPDVLLSIPLPDQFTSRHTSEHPRDQTFLSHIRAIVAHITPWGNLLFTLDFGYIDHLLSQLEGLEYVELHTKLIEREDDLLKRAQGQYIAYHLPLTRNRRGNSLRVYVNREHVPYIHLRDSAFEDLDEDTRVRIEQWPRQLADWFLTDVGLTIPT